MVWLPILNDKKTILHSAYFHIFHVSYKDDFGIK